MPFTQFLSAENTQTVKGTTRLQVLAHTTMVKQKERYRLVDSKGKIYETFHSKNTANIWRYRLQKENLTKLEVEKINSQSNKWVGFDTRNLLRVSFSLQAHTQNHNGKNKKRKNKM